MRVILSLEIIFSITQKYKLSNKNFPPIKTTPTEINSAGVA